MKNFFTDHLEKVNETYWQHLFNALGYARNLLIGGFALVVHAFFPFLLSKLGTQMIMKTLTDYVNRMPQADERMHGLAALLAQKIASDKVKD